MNVENFGKGFSLISPSRTSDPFVTVWNVKKRSGDKNSLSRDMNFIYMRSFPLDCRIDIEFVSFRFLFDYRR